jgi:hypothetical protein
VQVGSGRRSCQSLCEWGSYLAALGTIMENKCDAGLPCSGPGNKAAGGLDHTLECLQSSISAQKSP